MEQDAWNNQLDSLSDIIRRVDRIWHNVVKRAQGFYGPAGQQQIICRPDLGMSPTGSRPISLWVVRHSSDTISLVFNWDILDTFEKKQSLQVA